MRSLTSALVIASVLVAAVPAVNAHGRSAGSSSQASDVWTVIPIKDIPSRVRDGKERAYPKVEITKAEKTGEGETAYYRLTMNGKVKTAKFDATGKLIK